jgi:hypothetical protein
LAPSVSPEGDKLHDASQRIGARHALGQRT